MATSNQKLKTLYIMKLLLEQTDEKNTMSAQGIINALENQYGLTVDRKTIYTDIEILRTFGIDVLQNKGSRAGYYIGEREFELPELKLLVDAVQSSKFITSKKSRELIKKLETLTSKENGNQLQRQVYIYNRLKAENETIYYSIDSIHNAIYQNKQIHFQYSEWTCEGKLRLKRNGEFYIISPWALTWADENYYLVGYEESSDLIKNFRVDKMKQMSILDDSRQGAQLFKNFDLAVFSKKMFGMFGGKDEEVTMICRNECAGIVIDRFGKNVQITKEDDEHFRFTVMVALSPQFYGWLTGVGMKIQLKSPESARKEYKQYLDNVMELY